MTSLPPELDLRLVPGEPTLRRRPLDILPVLRYEVTYELEIKVKEKDAEMERDIYTVLVGTYARGPVGPAVYGVDPMLFY